MSLFSLNRRHLLTLSATALSLPAMALSSRRSRLVVVGGAEDRLKDKIILRRFLSLCGGESANIVVLTAASGDPVGAWRGYEQVFLELGATRVSHLVIQTQDDARSADTLNQILSADGIFMSGGDQRRLMERLLDTEAARAMHTAFHLRRCCIGFARIFGMRGVGFACGGLAVMGFCVGSRGFRRRQVGRKVDGASLNICGYAQRCICRKFKTQSAAQGNIVHLQLHLAEIHGIGNEAQHGSEAQLVLAGSSLDFMARKGSQFLGRTLNFQRAVEGGCAQRCLARYGHAGLRCVEDGPC